MLFSVKLDLFHLKINMKKLYVKLVIIKMLVTYVLCNVKAIVNNVKILQIVLNVLMDIS